MYVYIFVTKTLFTFSLLFDTIILRYDDVSTNKSNNQLSWSDRWSEYAVTVDRWFQESLGWIQDNCQENIDHHKILAGWCLSLSQRFLIMFTKMCDVFSTKLPVKYFEDSLAKIGSDASDKRVFDQCVGHKSPEGDLDGDKFSNLLIWNSLWTV